MNKYEKILSLYGTRENAEAAGDVESWDEAYQLTEGGPITEHDTKKKADTERKVNTYRSTWESHIAQLIRIGWTNPEAADRIREIQDELREMVEQGIENDHGASWRS